ncbi:hypothetical protein CALCODRAFT_148234 [Calocera cornea HHB12733]|uniref:Uncharacterized protein n=1 Tax=Calocera cornea HHB12733 TaxID=1353952 RepID=A0A165CQ43_9BASI|nr:hypothetical protein CALCODRAFT_148234 [Calocera cornea HHB12733]
MPRRKVTKRAKAGKATTHKSQHVVELSEDLGAPIKVTLHSVRLQDTVTGWISVRCLPTELLLMIFTAILLDDPPAHKTRVKLTHVCRARRTVVISYAPLWNRIVFFSPGKVRDRGRMAEIDFERAMICDDPDGIPGPEPIVIVGRFPPRATRAWPPKTGHYGTEVQYAALREAQGTMLFADAEEVALNLHWDCMM